MGLIQCVVSGISIVIFLHTVGVVFFSLKATINWLHYPPFCGRHKMVERRHVANDVWLDLHSRARSQLVIIEIHIHIYCNVCLNINCVFSIWRKQFQVYSMTMHMPSWLVVKFNSFRSVVKQTHKSIHRTELAHIYIQPCMNTIE